ncbi:V-type ATPase [Anaeromyces robustus]|uniref:V-type proton ATPase subunit G n=1 Tax=Anaeromyces robustus TaxID=1754192 RepID=A0A1Y1WWB9_9FUNG|nr:V-type ATPase [Anaeromyces robustus]|eukprot:ORX77695.1 V-type ATPase [Anaeromyces robustus]
MSTTNSQGIQTLIDAETEASTIVQNARQYRVKRLKDARAEAAKEIEELKNQKNAEFAEFEKTHSGSNDENAAKANLETEQKLREIENDYNNNKEKVVSKLVEVVLNVKPTIHTNYKM